MTRLAEWPPLERMKLAEEIQRQQRIRTASQDPISFGRIYCPEYFQHPTTRAPIGTPAVHREWLDLIDTAAAARQSLIIAAPRGHAKSTIFSFLLPFWYAVFRKKRFLVILSSDGDKAALFLDGIRREIESNDQLRADFGPLSGEEYGLPWGVKQLVIAHPQRGADGAILRDRLGHPIAAATIRLQAIGSGSSLRGLRSRAYRPDFLVADDMETDEHIINAEQRAKMRQWWYRAVRPMMDKSIGQIVVIGTILHHDSLLQHLIDRRDVYLTRLYKAWDAERAPLWPSQFTTADLERLQLEIGSLAFAQEYLNEPLDPASQVFKPAWWRWYTTDDVRYDAEAEGWRYQDQPMELYAAIDPALEGEDEFASIVIGLTADRHVLVLAFWSGHLDFPSQAAHIKALDRDWLPRTIGIEANGYQAALAQHVRREMLASIHPIKQTDGGGKPKRRIIALAPYAEAGQLILRAATATEPGTLAPEIGIKVHATQWPLYEQASQFPASAHDDRLDVLAMAIHVARVRKFFDEEGKRL